MKAGPDQHLIVGEPCRDMRCSFPASVEQVQLYSSDFDVARAVHFDKLRGRDVVGLVLPGFVQPATATDMEILSLLSSQAEAVHISGTGGDDRQRRNAFIRQFIQEIGGSVDRHLAAGDVSRGYEHPCPIHMIGIWCV